MNSPARRCVNAIPESSSLRSISPCIRAKRKGESRSGMMPDSLTTYLTPALRASSMKFDCTSSIAGSEDEISIARSTPRSAPVSVSGRAMSPSTISTFGKAENRSALAALRTRARTRTPLADSLWTNSLPFSPVAPVTRIILRFLSLFLPPFPLPREIIHTYRHLEIRIRWEHREKRFSFPQGGDFHGQECQADGVILPAQRRHSSQRGRSPPGHSPVPAAGDDVAAECRRKPVAAQPASDRLARC